MAAKHLAHGGLAASKVHIVGDVMYDATLFYKTRAKQSKEAASHDWAKRGLCIVHRTPRRKHRQR